MRFQFGFTAMDVLIKVIWFIAGMNLGAGAFLLYERDERWKEGTYRLGFGLLLIFLLLVR